MAELKGKSRIKTWGVEDLEPYARNARLHPESQILQLMASIREFGLVGAIVVRDGVIGKGHGTLEAVRRLYAAGEAVFPAPGEKGGAKSFRSGTIPVLDVSGWSDDQFRAYILTDNRLAEEAGWDSELVRMELSDLKAVGFNIAVTGFQADELDQAMARVGGVTLVEVADLEDRFWISLRGPLKQQARVLKALRDATKDLDGVEVELGTISDG